MSAPLIIRRRRAGAASRLSEMGVWLRARFITLAPEEIALAEGLRAACVTAAVVAATDLGHWPELSWAAFAAFWTCLTDPGGGLRSRLLAMGAFVLCGAACAALASGAANLGVAPVALLLLVASFFGSFARILGSAAAQVGILAATATAVAADYPASGPADVLTLALVFLGGGVWAMLVSALWRIHPLKPARRALAAVFRALGDLTAGLAELDSDRPPGEEAWTRHAADHRRTVRGAVETARAVLKRQAGGETGRGRRAERLLVALEAAERIFAQTIALGDVLETDPPSEGAGASRVRTLRQLAEILFRCGPILSDPDPDFTRLGRAADQLARMARRLSGQSGALLAAAAAQVAGLAESGAPRILALPGADEPVLAHAAPTQAVLTAIRSNLGWSSLALRHAARCAVCVVASYLAVQAMGLRYGYWATMATLLVMQPYVATTWPRAAERVVGSVLGGLVAAGLGLVLHAPLAMVVAVFPLTAATIALRSVNYSLFVFFLTPVFVLVIGLIHPENGEAGLALLRSFNNALGGVIAFVGCFVLWPGREPTRLRQQVAEAIRINVRYLAQALAARATDDRVLHDIRRAAGLASSNAEIACQRMALERWGHRGPLHAATALLAVTRRLAGSATAVWMGAADDAAADPPSDLAQWCQDSGERLAEAIAANRTVGPWQPPADADGLDDRSRRVVERMALLHAAARRFEEDCRDGREAGPHCGQCVRPGQPG